MDQRKAPPSATRSNSDSSGRANDAMVPVENDNPMRAPSAASMLLQASPAAKGASHRQQALKASGNHAAPVIANGHHAAIPQGQAGPSKVALSSQSPTSSSNSGIAGLPVRSPATASTTSAMAPSPALHQLQYQLQQQQQGSRKYVPPLSARAMEKRPMLDLQIPLERLEAEVQHEPEGLIPLTDVVTRLANYGYESLQNLGETMSSLSGEQRRSKIYNTALEARRQFIKLLVLSIWSSKAPGIIRTRDLIGLVNEQFNQSNDVVQELTAIRRSLPNSRARQYDLETAADVLNTGTYSRAPHSVGGFYEVQREYTDAEAKQIVEELNEAIQIRLSCGENLPDELCDYSIVDGRAILRASNLFEASITLSGKDPQDRWYLLSIEFDISVVGTGSQHFPRQPSKLQRTRIQTQADAVLTPRGLEPEGGLVAETEAKPPDRDMAGCSSDPEALTRLFSFLRTCALGYQLEALHYQARQLVSQEWGANLAVEWHPGRSLQLRYWNLLVPPAQNRSQAVARKPQDLLTSGVIIIEVPSEDTGSSDDEGEGLQRRSNARLTVKRPASNVCGADDPQVNCKELDLGQIMRTVTAEQAQHSLLRIVKAALPADEPTALLDIARRRVSVELALPAGRSLEVSLSCVSGRLDLHLADNAEGRQPTALAKALGSFAGLLADSTARVNADPRRFADVWRAIRLEVMMQDTEQRLAFAGLQSTRKLPFADGEVLKLDGMRRFAFIYAPVDRWPSYYLIVAISAEDIRVGLICADFSPSGGALFTIHSIEWIDRERIREAAGEAAHAFPLMLTANEIRQAHNYCIAIICYFRVEQQLNNWQVPFARVRSWPPQLQEERQLATREVHPSKIDALIPCLSLNSQELLGEFSEMVKPNVFLCIDDWWERTNVHARFAICWKANLGISAESTNTPEGLRVSYDPSTRIMRISASDIDRCVDAFKLFALRISRVAVLAKAVARVQKRKIIPKLRLNELSLSQISFEYCGGFTATVRWVMHLGGQWQYRLSLLARDAAENPHKLIERHLEAYLNNTTTSSSVHWLRFLRLLRDTFPMLDSLQALQKSGEGTSQQLTIEALSVSQVLVLFRKNCALDIRLISGSRLLLSDGYRCGLHSGQYPTLGFNPRAPRVQLPEFCKVVQSTYEQSKLELEPLVAKLAEESASPEAAIGKGIDSHAAARKGTVQPLVTNLRHSLLCRADDEVARPIVTMLVTRILSGHTM
ncbi:MED14-domain-containing protein [Tilletiaria anomala UBC 951]|uniref:Mediator of RNA polymerase II transcription subunit 14 n=1 Tax=Tilletiaria anomala (strain ATCC 24038 / CBS 436.72 / UBC 951) TaxID=1037660 RepID=A0A066VUC0_TILAU|nr:MED14-domain-containing protein [Tilletiaria anomala UBC 951]KDN42389.1 MED14-domain-containing protein [Tilletiaria anomala UBC 951]